MFRVYKEITPKYPSDVEGFLRDLLMYPEWRENERTLELMAWMLEQIGSWAMVILEDDYPELLENDTILQAIGRIVSKPKFSENFCMYEILKFIQRHEVLFNSSYIRQGLLSNTSTIGKTITDFENVCLETYSDRNTYASFCDLLKEIRKIDFLYNDENMQRELIATVPVIVEFLINHRNFETGGGYVGDYVLDNILGIPAYTSHYDLQIAIFHFLTEDRQESHYSARMGIDWVQRLLEDDILKDSPIVRAGFYESKRNEVEFSNEDIEFILNGIRDSKFPWISFLEIQKIPKLWNNDQISKLLHSRIADIAEYIQTVRYVTSIVLDIYKDPILMRSTSVIQALKQRVDELDTTWPHDDNLLKEACRGIVGVEDRMWIRTLNSWQLRESKILKNIQTNPDLQSEKEFQKSVIQYIVSTRKQVAGFKREIKALDEWAGPEAMIEKFAEEMAPIFKVISELREYQGLKEDKDIQEVLGDLINEIPDYLSFFRRSLKG